MASRDAQPSLPVSDAPTLNWARRVALCALLLIAVISVFVLERRFEGLVVEDIRVGETPATLTRAAGDDPLPLVVIAHGFGGSRQMMDQIAVTMARAGFLAASLDLPGHGRNPVKMSPDVTVIEGTTMQLVAAAQEVTEALRARDDVVGPVSFIGHSMATDVVIRTAEQVGNVGAIGAISMYSDAVTAAFPERLLIISGASEGHLRSVAMDALRLVEPEAEEGDLARAGGVERRALSAWGVGHVGVLYHQTTMREVARWAADAVGAKGPIRADLSGVAAGILFLSLVLMAPLLARLVPVRAGADVDVVPRQVFWTVILAPIPLAFGAVLIAPVGLGGVLGFGPLVAAFLVWGLVQLLVMRRMGVGVPGVDALGFGLVLAFGVGVFALAMDRYGGAFLPSGDRIVVMAMLLLGTAPLMIADARLMAGAPFWRRLVGRIPLIVTLSAAMAMAPTEIGLTFTVLPVLALFFMVYGLFQRVVSDRRGPTGPGVASGIALAWAIAASTPMFAVAAS